MAGNPDDDMYLFQSGYEQTPGYAGQAFDDFLTSPPSEEGEHTSPGFLNPNDLAIKREVDDQDTPQFRNTTATRSPPSSSGSSRSSSSTSAKRHFRDVSEASTASRADVKARNGVWRSGINGMPMPSNDELFASSEMTGLEDYTASNEQMESDFDFATAASTPSGFDSASMSVPKRSAMQPFRGAASYNSGISHIKSASPRLPAAQPHFFFGGSRETSPLSAMLPASQAQSPWAKHSPSSGLEETFNGITMNGDSPGNATFTPNLQFSSNGFTFDADSSATPSTFTKDISSPPSTVNSADGTTKLVVLPTSLKSRVETQIPIKMILSPLPPGVKKLRLPTHTVSKPKFLAKPEVDSSPEILELYTSLVCTSAMQDPMRKQRAYARARGEEVPPLSRASPASSIGSPSSRDDEEKPLNGGEVRICSGCIQRERKRASRKKQKKPDEEELFQKDEEKRVVVFNTNEIKDWVEPTKDTQSGGPSNEATPPGAMQVELPMRIACYCRHQNEKMGFQVIFTIKDSRGNLVAQQITNSIMITDDHKTHNAPPLQQNPSPAIPQAPQLPGAGVFSTSGMDMASVPNPKLFKQSFSTTDLHGLQYNFNPSLPMTPVNHPFAIPSAPSTGTSATLTPRNLSRPASPSGPSGPMTKRRKQSGSGKLPSTLTMTRLEASQGLSGPSTMPNTAASSPFAPNMSSFMNVADRGFAMPTSRPQQFGTSPPTPNGYENGGMVSNNRSYSLENLSRQAVISAPSSRQPSRPGSPGSNRNSFGAADPNFGHAVSNQLLGQPSRRPPPLIHKLVPAEGTMAGGTEVTLLGNGFYQGLEVMFGDTEATTTTFWGEKCLNCITPPAIQPGVVAVMFKHEHPSYGGTQQQAQGRQSVFTYIDDREVEMYRLALKTLGQQMQHPTDNPYSAAQQLLNGGTMQPMWPPQGSYGGMAGGHQRQATTGLSEPIDLLELESNMLRFISHIDQRSTSRGVVRLDICRPTGLTLLHLASSLGLTRFVAALVARGASVDVLDNNGNTPLHHAAMNGHTHIIHRLRLAGADHRIRSIRNFVPADLATSLLAHQAAVISRHHYRSRSAGGTPIQLHSRNNSSASLRSFWEHTSSNQAFSENSDVFDSDSDVSEQGPGEYREPVTASHSGAVPVSRRNSSQTRARPRQEEPNDSAQTNERSISPAAYMWAWRNSLAQQINQFQESEQWNLPNLPALPALPTLPDYQTNPMMRRVSSLFPQRPASRQGGPSAKERWWESFTGSTPPSAAPAPPSYNELYPDQKEREDDLSTKKVSMIQAAADAAVDLYYGAQEGRVSQSAKKADQDEEGPGRKLVPRDQIQRIELSRDRKLFLFWIPLLALILALMLRNTLPDVLTSTSTIYERMMERDRILEVV